MPPIIPLAGLNGVEPFEPSGTGKPKRRGPQGQENKGDAGYGLQFPQLQLPKLPTLQIPGIQRAGGQVVDLAPDVTDDAPSTAVPFRERPRIEHTKTVTGWVKNLMRDVEDFFAAIPATAKVAWQAGSEILKNYEWLDDLVKNPELLTKELDRTTRRVIKATVDDFSDRWRHGGGEALYKSPFSSMLDILAVFDLAGGALKVAGKAGVRMGSKEAASLAKLGQSIQGYPGRMIAKPFQMTVRALEKTPYVGDLMRAKALTPLGKELNALAGAKQLEYVNQAQAKARELFRRGIPRKLWDKHEEFLDGVLPRELIDDPRILERYDEWMSEVQSAEREFLDFGIMDETRLTNARLQQTAIKLQEKGYFQGELYKLVGDEVKLSDEAMGFAQDWIDGKNPWGKATTPVYRPFQTERTLVQSLEDLFESLRGGERVGHATGFQSRFQKRTGQNAYVHNPDVWQAKSLLNRARLRASIDYWNDVTARYGKPLKGPKADPGYRIVPPLLKRYVENDIVNVQTMLLQKATEARQALKLAGEADDARALYEGVKLTKKELEANLDGIQADLKAALDDPKSMMVQIPEEAAYIMDKMMTGPRGFWRWYDNTLDTWRDMILTFMPRYYVNNLLGNAVMLFFGGHSPIGKRAAMAEDTIPGEAMQTMLGAEAGNASSFLARPFAEAQRPVRRLAEKMAEITDSRARQVFLTTAGKEILEREAILDNTIAQALISTEAAADAVDILLKARREVLGSPLQELQETRKILKAADGNAAAIEASMRTGAPDKLYKLRAKAMPGTVRTPADQLQKEIANIQTQITREKALSNVEPTGLASRDRAKNAEIEAQIRALESEKAAEMKAATRQPTTLKHFTTAEAAGKLEAGEAFNASLLPQHGTGGLGKGPKTGKFAGDRIYLSLDDAAWNKALREKPGGRIEPATMANKDHGVPFFDYDKQKWMVEIGGHEEVALKPVTFAVNPQARILRIDSDAKLRRLQEQTGHYWDAEGKAFWKALERDWDVVEIRNTKDIDNDFFNSAKADQAIVLNADAVDIVRGGQSRFSPKPFDHAPVDAQIAALRAQIKTPSQKMFEESSKFKAQTDKRLAELRSQMEMRVKQLEEMTGKSLADTFGAKVLELPDVARLSELQQRRAALQPYADIGEQVIRRMEGFFGNYGRLHPIEREYIRRVIPFWTFARTTFKLAFQLPFLRTKQSFLWNQFAKMLIDAQGDDRLPGRFRTYLPFGGTEDGDILFLNIKNLNPFEKATEISSFGKVPMPQFIDPRNNPFVKVAVESIGGYDLFTEKPMVEMQQYVKYDGSVWELDPETGRVEPIIPQKPIIKSLFQQIPHMKIMGELMTAAGFPEVGAAFEGRDKAPRNPDGTLTYDRSYMHSIARAAGFPVTVQNPDKVRQQHMMLKRGMARRWRSAANRVDPETRMQLESILRDLERAEVWE